MTVQDLMGQLADMISTKILERFAVAQAVPEQLCYTEEETARILSLKPHTLQAERRRGRIKGTRIAGRRVRYTRQDILDYLSRR